MNETTNELKKALDILNELLHEVAFVPGVESSPSAYGLREAAKKAEVFLKERGYDMSKLGVYEEKGEPFKLPNEFLADWMAEDKK